MKNVKFLLISVLFLGLAGLSSCKKEDRIEKNLWKGDGTWNIDVWDEQNTSSYFSEDNYIKYSNNEGSIQFKKDGTGSYIFPGEIYPMVYSNTDKTLTITFKDEDGNVENDEVQVFDLDWKKNKMELRSYSTETYNTGDGNGGTVNVITTHRLNLKLSKK